MGNKGCCSSPNQTRDDYPVPAANDDFINWCFDALEDNLIIELNESTIENVLRRCDELRDQAKDVEFEKMRMNLPQISAVRVREVGLCFSQGSVWIGKVDFEGKDSYLEIIIGRKYGSGKRVVDYNQDISAPGIFSLSAEVDVTSQRVKSRRDHEEHGFKIIFKWEDEGEDFKLKLMSDNFDGEQLKLSGTAIINENGVGRFELIRAINGKNSTSRRGRRATPRDFASIESYSSLAMKKSLADLEGTSVKKFVFTQPNIMQFTSKDGEDLSLDGYAYE